MIYLLHDKEILLYRLFVILNTFVTNLDSWRVEEAPHYILTPAVGREMKWSEASLAREFSHKARGSHRRNLSRNIKFKYDTNEWE